MYSASLMPSISANDIAAVRQKKKGISIFREKDRTQPFSGFCFHAVKLYTQISKQLRISKCSAHK